MIKALFGSRQKTTAEIDRLDLQRLLLIKEQARRLVKLLDDGQVDYELVEELKGVINGQRSERA